MDLAGIVILLWTVVFLLPTGSFPWEKSEEAQRIEVLEKRLEEKEQQEQDFDALLRRQKRQEVENRNAFLRMVVVAAVTAAGLMGWAIWEFVTSSPTDKLVTLLIWPPVVVVFTLLVWLDVRHCKKWNAALRAAAESNQIERGNK